MQRQGALAIGGIARVIATVALEHPLVRAGVDLVDARPERGDASGDERLPQPLRGERQVCGHAHAAEALAEHAPALDPELAADPFGVADDRVGSEVREVVGLCCGVMPGNRPDRRRAARAALVEHQHAELRERSVQPGGRVRPARGSRSLEPGTALEVHEKRPVPAVGIGELPREHRDSLAGIVVVIEWHLERMLDRPPGRAAALRRASVNHARNRRAWHPDSRGGRCNVPTGGGFHVFVASLTPDDMWEALRT